MITAKPKIINSFEVMICILTHEYPPARGGAEFTVEKWHLPPVNSIKVSVWAPLGSIKDDSFKLTDLPWKGSQSFHHGDLFIKQKVYH